jgi:GAF domain-containing protein
VYVVHGDELAPGPSRGDTAPGGTELVVPILSGDETIGEIHVESDRPQAFGPADRAFLEHVARLIAPAARAEVLSRD